jgi:hypothetical protein
VAKAKRNFKSEREAYYKRVVEPAKVAADIALCVLEKNIRDLLLAWPVGGMRNFSEDRPNDVVALLNFIKGKERYNLCFEGAPVILGTNMRLFNRCRPGADTDLLRVQTAAERACSYYDDTQTIMDALYPEKTDEAVPEKPEVTPCQNISHCESVS